MTEWIVPGVVFVGLIALVWRQTAALQSMAGLRTRAVDRERHDAQQLMERLVEKCTSVDPADLARLHHRERALQTRTDSTTDRDISLGAKKNAPVEDEYVRPEDYEP